MLNQLDYRTRFEEFLDTLNMSREGFGKSIGINKVTMTNNVARGFPSVKFLEVLHRHHPRLNINWLLFGNGTMWTDTEIVFEKEKYRVLAEKFEQLNAKLQEVQDVSGVLHNEWYTKWYTILKLGTCPDSNGQDASWHLHATRTTYPKLLQADSNHLRA